MSEIKQLARRASDLSIGQAVARHRVVGVAAESLDARAFAEDRVLWKCAIGRFGRRPWYNPHMIDEREVWACANQLMKRHGDNAWFVAAQRADELFYVGDMAGHQTFARIVRRIEELEAIVPGDAVH